MTSTIKQKQARATELETMLSNIQRWISEELEKDAPCQNDLEKWGDLRSYFSEKLSNLRSDLGATYTGKDQNHADETTIYWFDFECEAWGVADHNGNQTILDCDGCPVTPENHARLVNVLIVTEEMINDF